MKLTVALLLLTYVSFSYTEELSEECKCWSHFQPRNTGDGLKCYKQGVILNTMDCNVPQPPRCKCSGRLTGIMIDKFGKWCTEYTKGIQVRKWECENQEEWEEFFKKNPDRKRG